MMMCPRRRSIVMTDVLLVVVIAVVALFASAANSTSGGASSSASSAIRKRRRRLQSSPTNPTTSTASKEATTTTATTSTNDWPYHVDLELTFDDFPIDISWKFINIARPSILLAGVPFGTYTNDEYAGRTIVVPLSILTREDYHDSYEEEEEKRALRQYKFIIYDQVTFIIIIYSPCSLFLNLYYYISIRSHSRSLHDIYIFHLYIYNRKVMVYVVPMVTDHIH